VVSDDVGGSRHQVATAGADRVRRAYPRTKAYQLRMPMVSPQPGLFFLVVSGDSGRSGNQVDDRRAVVGVAAVAAVAA
jgi:hypothetical protein